MDYADQFRRAIREVEDEQKKELEEVFSDAFKDSRVAFNTLCKFLSLNQFPLSREQIVTSIEDLTYSRDLLDEQHKYCLCR